MESQVRSQAEIECYLKVDKADGRVLYYKVVDGKNIEISEQEYEESLNNLKK